MHWKLPCRAEVKLVQTPSQDYAETSYFRTHAGLLWERKKIKLKKIADF